MSGMVLTDVENARQSGAIAGSADFQQVLERIDELPAMPVIAQKMLALPLNTDKGEAQLLKLIAQDPQISARVIGLSNASLFGAPGMITSISDATMRLGLVQVKSIAIGMATIAAFTKPPEGKFNSTDLWSHSIAIASVMRTIARHMPARNRPQEDRIFLAGLLHDIGYSVLNYLARDLSNMLYEKLNESKEASLLEVEQALLGASHGEIGARLAAHWGLPPEIIAVIRYHHQPDHPDAAIGQPLVRLINVAEKMLPDYAISEHVIAGITEQEWLQLGIETAEIQCIAEEVAGIAEQVQQLANAA